MKASDKAFSHILRKVGETAKCLDNIHVKTVAVDLRATNERESEASAITRAAETTRLTAASNVIAVDAGMTDAPISDAISPPQQRRRSMTRMKRPATLRYKTHVYSESSTDVRPIFDVPTPALGPEKVGSSSPGGLEKEDVHRREGLGEAGVPSSDAHVARHAVGYV